MDRNVEGMVLKSREVSGPRSYWIELTDDRHKASIGPAKKTSSAVRLDGTNKLSITASPQKWWANVGHLGDLETPAPQDLPNIVGL